MTRTFILTAALTMLACSEPDPRPAAGMLSSNQDPVVPDGLGGMGGEESGAEEPETPDERMDGIPCGETTCEVGTCDETEGGALCACPDGFGPADAGCPDRNECTKPDTCPGAVCHNTVGSFYCECPPGQTWDGEGCAGINECDALPCDPGASCLDTETSYECVCQDDTAGNGDFCKKEPKCEDESCLGGACVETQSGFVCQCTGGTGGTKSCKDQCNTIQLDPALDAAVRDLVGLPVEAGPIMPIHLEGLDTLDASMRDVHTLDGLECWPHLVHLNLSGTPLGAAPDTYPEPLTAISALNRLETLNLSCTQLSDLTGLDEHPSLRELRMDNQSPECAPSLTNAGALAGLTRLEVLALGGHSLESFPPVAAMVRLRYLDVRKNQIQSLDDLSRLHQLQVLLLAGNQISELSSVSGRGALAELDVGDNEVSTLDDLELPSLRTLRAPSNQISTLGSLALSPFLVSLDVSLNTIDDIAAIAAHPSLRTLTVSGNEITSLEPLVASEYVGILNIASNPLPCETERAHLDALISQGVQIFGDCVP